MYDYLIGMLQCPACRGALDWQVQERHGDRVQTATARCIQCAAEYPVRDGIAIFLTPDLPREDLWAAVEGQLSKYLRENPEIRAQLMDQPLKDLEPADQFFRAMVLEEQGKYQQAQMIMSQVESRLYTQETLICQESQFSYLVEHVRRTTGPVVDLASGRGALVLEMARYTDRPIVATDFSLQVLRRDRERLDALGYGHRVSLLAMDARRTPFKAGAIGTLTTNQGLGNIREGEGLLKEMRRIVCGDFLAVTHFYPEVDSTNRAVIEELGLAGVLYRENLEQRFEAAGWKMIPANICHGRALPTPQSAILEGLGIDALPKAETELAWTTLVAS